MVQIDISYRGELRCESSHGPSGTALITDAPKDNEGLGSSFSPTDLVAAALGSCMLTIMGIVAKRHSWALEGARVEVTKGMVADPERRIGRLEVRFLLPDGFDAQVRTALERAAVTCPVHKSLDPRIEVPVHFGWGELGAAGA